MLDELVLDLRSLPLREVLSILLLRRVLCSLSITCFGSSILCLRLDAVDEGRREGGLEGGPPRLKRGRELLGAGGEDGGRETIAACANGELESCDCKAVSDGGDGVEGAWLESAWTGSGAPNDDGIFEVEEVTRHTGWFWAVVILAARLAYACVNHSEVASRTGSACLGLMRRKMDVDEERERQPSCASRWKRCEVCCVSETVCSPASGKVVLQVSPPTQACPS